MSNKNKKEEFVYQSCLLVVRHCKNLIVTGETSFHTRIFEYILHPEYDFVGIGKSVEVALGAKHRKEHIVPCAVMYREVTRLIGEKALSEEEIAKLLQKHWKVAHITEEQAQLLDIERKMKSTMPDGWCFETGDPMERLHQAQIEIVRDDFFPSD